MTQANNYLTRLILRVLILSAVTAASLSVFLPEAPAGEAPAASAVPVKAPTGRQVRAAIVRSIDYMRGLQGSNGRWPD
jgi:hypothetical protein